MTKKHSSLEIDDLAAEWAAKVDAGELAAEQLTALDAWLESDPRHLGAFAKARAVAVHSKRAIALGPNFDPPRFATREHSWTRRGVLAGGITASAASVGIALFARALAWRTYDTGLGETRVVSLQDGSVITLNTESSVAIKFTNSLRDIRLARGEALFDVAKDAQRPFVVEANGTLVRAVGTSFTVRALENEPVQVLVREGIVEVKQPNSEVTAVRAEANTKVVASVVTPMVSRKLAQAEIGRELAWRMGRLAFEGETLQQAAAAFARYSEVRIVIDDPKVASNTVTGLFVSNDPVGFSKAVALALGLHATLSDNKILLTR